MKFPRRHFLRMAMATAALSAMPWTARAQAYPTRPITIIVAFTAGGPTDTAARIVAERMGDQSISAGFCSRAPPVPVFSSCLTAAVDRPSRI